MFCHCIRPRKRAVLLLNLGTPDSTEAADVRRYLREFLSDPFVINLPQRWSWFTPILGRLIARFRARKSAEAYASIWWDEGSPLKVITQRQEQALGQLLGGGWQVYHAMRYANPSIADTLRRIARDMVTDLVVIPMYPQWAGPTTGTALEVLYREMRRQGLRLSVTVRGEWYNDRAYLDAQARLIARFAGERDLNPRNSFLLFSTHSMPVSYIKEGDPYEGQVRESVELVRHLLNWPADRMALSFQSKLGPVPWLGPGTDKALEKLAADGEKNVLVCPISFTADCLETLEEIGEGYAHEFSEASKGGRLHLIPALNEDALFIRCLEGLTRRGPQPVHQRDMAAGSIAIERPPSLPTLLPRLLVVGMATPGQLETDNPRHFTDAQTLRCARQSKGDIHRLLRRIGRHALVDGGMMLHTCQRSEAIILLREPAPDASEWSSLVRLIFPDHADADLPALRTLTGVEAYRRLLRTAMGLNSILPGDADVIEQMLSGGRMAEHAGTLSPGLAVLLRHIEDTVRTISRQSAWGEFMTDFCHAAVHDLGIPTDAQCTESVILGGSVTCRQILKRLTHDGGRGGDRLTFVHRGTGGKELLHFLRTTAPNARQIRVHRYDEPLVREAISNADVVYIGIDRREPVLRAEHLIGPRDFARRPLRIIDFNSHGSTVGMDSIEGVELITAKTLLGAAMRFGGQVIERPGFTAAFGEVERWIEDLIGEHSSEVPPSIERACCPDAREASELSEVTA
ncbi:MAG: ferrochelatase [Phycisphaeraceae bacterium]|nr:ferrochelatase [Phycisphaeraceae bacterium]